MPPAATCRTQIRIRRTGDGGRRAGEAADQHTRVLRREHSPQAANHVAIKRMQRRRRVHDGENARVRGRRRVRSSIPLRVALELAFQDHLRSAEAAQSWRRCAAVPAEAAQSWRRCARHLDGLHYQLLLAVGDCVLDVPEILRNVKPINAEENALSCGASSSRRQRKSLSGGRGGAGALEKAARFRYAVCRGYASLPAQSGSGLSGAGRAQGCSQGARRDCNGTVRVCEEYSARCVPQARGYRAA